MLIHPRYRISDPGSNNRNKKRRGKNMVLTKNLTKLKKKIFFETGTEKKLSQLTMNCITFYPKIVNKLSKI
jgi:hypothetical protein